MYALVVVGVVLVVVVQSLLEHLLVDVIRALEGGQHLELRFLTLPDLQRADLLANRVLVAVAVVLREEDVDDQRRWFVRGER